MRLDQNYNMANMRQLRTRNVVRVVALVLMLSTFFQLSANGRMLSLGWKPPAWKIKAGAKEDATLNKISLEWKLTDDVLSSATHQNSISGPFLENLLDEVTRAVTSRDSVRNSELLQIGLLSAFEIVTAFCKRAAYAHQLNRNMLEIDFEAAQNRGRELDHYFRVHGKPIGPLHGLPFTTKDQFHMKGLDTTMAYVGWIGTQAGRQRTNDSDDLESEVISELVSLGAIPIGKTTCMQGLWAGETENNILGYLWNPSAKSLSAGGSSGGEGAFQGLRGASFGLATDIGGSVTMPAAFNGIYGLKPSHGRISFKNTAKSSAGQIAIPTVVGIVGNSVGILRKVFEALLSTEPWLKDAEVLPVPYRSEYASMPKKIAVGVFEFDGIVMPHPPVVRAIRMVAKALESAGHQTIAWKPPSHSEPALLHVGPTCADGRFDVIERTNLSGEPLAPLLKHLFNHGKPPTPMPATQLFHLTQRLLDFRSAYAEYWSGTKSELSTGRVVDAVLMPVAPHAAPRPGKSFWYTYGSVINVLDYCSVVIPVTKVDAEVDIFDTNYEPLNDKDKKTWEAYDPEIYDGAPIGIQIVGRKLEEEKILAISGKVIEALEADKASLHAK